MILFATIEQTIMICLIVFATMLLIDFGNVLSTGRISGLIRGAKWRQYIGTSFLGTIPGCIGSFTNATLYIRGLISFGAIVGGMFAASGDEAFVMIAMFPQKAAILFGILFILGIFVGWLTDKLVPFLKIQPCVVCEIDSLHKEDKKLPQFGKFDFFLPRIIIITVFMLFLLFMFFHIMGADESLVERVIIIGLLIFSLLVIAFSNKHYLTDHIIKHLLANHLYKIFLWTFFSLLLIGYAFQYLNLEAMVKTNMLWVFPIAAIVGFIPESGPHLIFVALYATGAIPFSVLLTSSIVQDGHGMLPVFAFSIRDALLIKVFNFCFGMGLGLLLFSLGF